MLRAVQYVEIGKGKSRERRKLSFRTLDVEQIGYVYEACWRSMGSAPTTSWWA